MSRRYLKDGEQVFTTGAYLRWNKEKGYFKLDEIDGSSDTFCDGDLVNFDEHGKPFVGE